MECETDDRAVTDEGSDWLESRVTHSSSESDTTD